MRQACHFSHPTWCFIMVLTVSPCKAGTDATIPAEYVSIDLDAIRLENPLRDQDDSLAEFDVLTEQFSEAIARGRDEDLCNATLIHTMVAFIRKYPRSVHALTVKLYLGTYLGVSRERFVGQKNLAEKIKEDALAICGSIGSEFSETWQGRLCRLGSSEDLRSEASGDPLRCVEAERRALPELMELDKDPAFVAFQRAIGNRLPMDVVVRRYIFQLLLTEVGDVEAAEGEIKALREKYPDGAFLRGMEILLQDEKKMRGTFRDKTRSVPDGGDAGEAR